MAKKDISSKIKDLETCRYAQVAQSFAQSKEGQQYLPGALELLAAEMGMNKKSQKLFVQSAIRSQQTLESVFDVYGGDHEEELGKLTLGEFYTLHQKTFEEYGGDESKVLDDKYSSSNMTIKDLKSKMLNINHKLQSPDEKEREGAKKERDKNKELFTLWQTMESEYYENLRFKAVRATNKSRVSELSKSAYEEELAKAA